MTDREMEIFSATTQVVERHVATKISDLKWEYYLIGKFFYQEIENGHLSTELAKSEFADLHLRPLSLNLNSWLDW